MFGIEAAEDSPGASDQKRLPTSIGVATISKSKDIDILLGTEWLSDLTIDGIMW